MKSFQTIINVPSGDLQELMNRLARAGAIVMDTGERVTTDDGPEAEACLAVCFVDPPEMETTVEVATAVDTA